MKVELVDDKSVLYEFLMREAGLQIYLTGDLDDFFFLKTKWYALSIKNEIKSVALLYCGNTPPTLLCFQKLNREYAIKLLQAIKSLLPFRFYAHLGEGFTDVFGRANIVEHYGVNYKMVLHNKVESLNDPHIRKLNGCDLSLLSEFYSEAYPHNWFDSRMLDSEKYLGYFIESRLAGVAGVHVYSGQYRVAALGNIATHPDFRHHGIGYKLTVTLCADLQRNIDIIGLNVRSENEHAIRLYRKIGFLTEGIYEESLLQNDFQ